MNGRTHKEIAEISDIKHVEYRFYLTDDLLVRLTDVVIRTKRTSRCRKWSNSTWRNNGHKNFKLTHVPPDVVSAAIEHFKKSIHWVSPEF